MNNLVIEQCKTRIKNLLKYRNLNTTITAIFILILNLSAYNSYAGNSTQDPRYASSICTVNKEFIVSCEYKYSARLDVKAVQLEVDGREVQVEANKHEVFKATKEQTIELLILVDVSDPRRKNTVEQKYINSVNDILKNLTANQNVGIAEFDSEIRLLAPIGADINSLKNVAQSFKATGQATEFYKNILAAIDLLKKTKGDRKGLIILSDGKDEDRAYKVDDVVKLAKENNISILSLGYLEGKQETPFLQSLKRLADETHGLYYDVTDENGMLPASLARRPFSFIEKGGKLSYQLAKTYENHKLNLTLSLVNGDKINLTSEITPIDERTKWQQIIDYTYANWIYVGLAVLMVLIIIVIVSYYAIKIIKKNKPTTYATLVEMNGMGTKHEIQQTAIRIGRGSENDISLENDSISMNHAEIHRRREGDFYIVDLASTNGVVVNEEKTNRRELKNNDIIELGEVRLRFSLTN